MERHGCISGLNDTGNIMVPQGGIDERETPEQAMYRELYEEVGLTKRM